MRIPLENCLIAFIPIAFALVSEVWDIYLTRLRMWARSLSRADPTGSMSWSGRSVMVCAVAARRLDPNAGLRIIN